MLLVLVADIRSVHDNVCVLTTMPHQQLLYTPADGKETHAQSPAHTPPTPWPTTTSIQTHGPLHATNTTPCSVVILCDALSGVAPAEGAGEGR